MQIKAPTLYEAWKGINNSFINDDPSDAMLMPGRDFSFVKYNIELDAQGFGLPETPPPLFNKDRRVKLLEKRYIDPYVWDEGINRLIERRDRSTGSQPNSFLMLYHRRDTNERKVPAGGGCLVSLNFTWWNKGWHLHILSRASEITNRLLGDSYFVKHSVDKIIEATGLKKWDPENVHITWNLLLPSQMKYMVFHFLLYTEGVEVLKDFVTSPPKNAWQEVVIEHFWKEFIHPEKISWAQRRKWSEQFIKETPEVNWGDLAPRTPTIITPAYIVEEKKGEDKSGEEKPERCEDQVKSKPKKSKVSLRGSARSTR